MIIRYDDDLLEAAVFLCASGHRQGVPALQVARFNRERERIYELLDADEREAAFAKLHLNWFQEWGLEKKLTDVLNEFPILAGDALNAIAFRKAKRPREEGAELYVHESGIRTGLVALRVERFKNGESLTPFLLRELTHIQDMVDPAFGYSPELHLPPHTQAQERLVRERYQLLWSITVEGRLVRDGRLPASAQSQFQQNLSRAFSFWPEERQNELFDSLWLGHHLRHTELLALASDPRDLRQAHRPAPGASCPLCGFPTFDWAPQEQLQPDTVAAIRADFPNWTVEQGACARCCDIYHSRLRALGNTTHRHDCSELPT